jgi:hypothetical protein
MDGGNFADEVQDHEQQRQGDGGAERENPTRSRFFTARVPVRLRTVR